MLAAVSISKLTPVAKLIIISFFSCLLTVRFGSYFVRKKNVNKPSALLT